MHSEDSFAPLRLSRHGHRYSDPAIASYVDVVGMNDREGGTVEVRLHLWNGYVGRNGYRDEQGERMRVPAEHMVRAVVCLTRGEARKLAERLRDAASLVDVEDRPALEPVVPAGYAALGEQTVRGEWKGGCSGACSYGHLQGTGLAPIVEGEGR